MAANPDREQPPRWEEIAAVAALVVIFSALGYLLYLAFTMPMTPPGFGR